MDVTPTATVEVPGAERVLAALRAKFRVCYNHALQGDPGARGKLVLTADIAASGEVTSVAVTSNEGLPDDLEKCAATALQNATFDPPGRPSKLTVPLRLSPQN
jgi:outer membrane biosynthesis protein TonB